MATDKVIIDTNVIHVANQKSERVKFECVSACIEFLTMSRKNRVVLIDAGDEIRKEYMGAFEKRRPYSVGSLFLHYLFQNLGNPGRVQIVRLQKTEDQQFADFPNVPELSNFDRSDRKFAALARKTGTAVTNAVDGDWADNAEALEANGIMVDFLCGAGKEDWFHP